MIDEKLGKLVDAINTSIEKAETFLPVACPTCLQEFYVSKMVMVPNEQRMSFKIEMKGELCGAGVFGHCLTNMEKILKETAKTLGSRIEVFLESVEQKPNSIQANLLLMAVAPKSRKRGGISKNEIPPSKV